MHGLVEQIEDQGEGHGSNLYRRPSISSAKSTPRSLTFLYFRISSVKSSIARTKAEKSSLILPPPFGAAFDTS